MAIFNPTNTPIISKIQIGSNLYYLTDAEARALLNQLGDAAKKGLAANVAAGEDGLVTGAQVAAAIANLEGAVHFVGVSTTDPATGTVTIDGNVHTAEDGDIVLYGAKEFIYGNSKWNELGDEGIYVTKSTTIAGVDLNDSITVAELQTALGLGAMAYAATASGSIAGETISGVKATGTPAGTVSVTLDQTSTAATLTKGNYTPAGTISTPAVNVTPTTTSISGIDSVGTQSSFTQGSKASWSASVSDDGTLSFAFTANGDDTFTAGDLPTKATAVDAMTGATAALAAAPTFTGTEAENILVTAVNYDKASVNSASFSGTAAEFDVGDIAVAAKSVTVTPDVAGS